MIVEGLCLGAWALVAATQAGDALSGGNFAGGLVGELVGSILDRGANAFTAKITPDRNHDFMRATAEALRRAIKSLRGRSEIWTDDASATWTRIEKDVNKLLVDTWDKPQKAVRDALLLGKPYEVRLALQSLLSPYFVGYNPEIELKQPIGDAFQKGEKLHLIDWVPPFFFKAFEEVLKSEAHAKAWIAFQRDVAWITRQELRELRTNLGKEVSLLLDHLQTVSEGNAKIAELSHVFEKAGREMRLVVERESGKTREELTGVVRDEAAKLHTAITALADGQRRKPDVPEGPRMYTRWRGTDPSSLERKIQYGIRRVYAGVYRQEDDFEYWAGCLLRPDAPRLFVINGPSGRGKTSFALQIRKKIREARPDSVHFWLDCMYKRPNAENLSALLGSDDLVRWTNLPKYLEDADASLVEDASSVLGSNAPPIFVYLDDADRALADLGDQASPLRRFLNQFQSASAFRFVFTSRDYTFGRELERFLDLTAGAVAETGGGDDRGTEDLALFHREHVRHLLTGDGVPPSAAPLAAALNSVWAVAPDLLEATIHQLCADPRTKEQRSGTDPLDLVLLVESVFHTPAAERVELLRNWAQDPVPLRMKLFHERLANTPPDVRKVALAVAVLQDPEYPYVAPLRLPGGRDPIDVDTSGDIALRFVTGMEEAEFAAAFRSLRSRGDSRAELFAGNEILLPDDREVRFALDPIRDYFYYDCTVGTRENDREALKAIYHRRAAEYYDPDLEPGIAEPDDAAWHYLRVGLLDDAARCIELAASQDEDQNRYARANVLRTRICRVIAGAGSDFKKLPPPGDTTPAPQVALWATHMAELSHILYQQGWEVSYDEAWDAARMVTERAVPDQVKRELGFVPAGTHDNEQAALLAELVMAAVDFERPTAQSARSIDELVETVGNHIKRLKEIEQLRQQEDSLGQELLETNGQNLLGILHNRKAEFDIALGLYEKSAERWRRHLADPRFSKANPLDLLRAVSSQARSLMLLGRAGEGAQRLKDWFIEYPHYLYTWDASLESQDRAFAFVNWCQCHMAQNRLDALDPHNKYSIVRLFYQVRKSPTTGEWGLVETETALPQPLPRWAKIVREEWIERYMDALVGAHHFYAGRFSEAKTVFVFCAEHFRDQGETRDEFMMRINAGLCDLCAFLADYWQGQTCERELSLGAILVDLIQQAEGIADEPIVRNTLSDLLYRLQKEAVEEQEPKLAAAIQAYQTWVETLAAKREDPKFLSALSLLFSPEGKPLEEGFEDMREWTLNCFGPLINGEYSQGEPASSRRPDYLRWLPVIVMRGALILRPKPITSLRF
jgi:NACHT domain.